MLRVGGLGRQPAPARFAILLVFFLSLIGLDFSGSPLTVLAGAICFCTTVALLWRTTDLPVLLLPAMYQWLQVAVKPILTIIYEQPIEDVANFGFHLGPGLEPAALFGFAGVMCLAIGLKIGSGTPNIHVDQLRAETTRWSRRAIIPLSVSAIAVGHIVDIFAGLSGTAIQLILPFSAIKSVGLFVLAYWCFINRTGYRYLAAVMAFEIVIGLTGFFADFREPVLVLALAAISARPTIRPSNIAIITVVTILILGIATFWSAVKNDYRSFANGGTSAQAVVQPFDARLDYLYQAALGFDSAQFADGFEKLLSRFSYIDFLGATLSYVPMYLPHQDGSLMGSALLNIATPRILFPDKAPVPDDTEVTRRYTGLDLRNVEGTSISIGYLGDLYIDFGYVGALVATVIVGIAMGFGYRILRDYDRLPRLITFGITSMLILPLAGFETELIKYIDGAVLTFGGALVVQRIIAPRVLAMYVVSPRRRPVPLVRR